MAIREMLGKTYNTRNKSSSDKMSADMEFAKMRAEAKSADGTMTATATAGGLQSMTQTRLGGDLPSQLQTTVPIAEGNEAQIEEKDSEKEKSATDSASNVGGHEGDEEIGVVPFDYEEEFRKANKQL